MTSAPGIQAWPTSRSFQLDILKIDKSFIDNLGVGNADGGSLVKAIISLAESLQLEVVAEGIERPAQRDDLHAMRCRLGQGYLYSKPVDGDAMTALLALADASAVTHAWLAAQSPAGERMHAGR